MVTILGRCDGAKATKQFSPRIGTVPTGVTVMISECSGHTIARALSNRDNSGDGKCFSPPPTRLDLLAVVLRLAVAGATL